MSVFPFIDPETLAASQDSALPMFREYAYDYENNRLLLRNGQTYLVEGNEALRIRIFKALDTARFRYAAYDSEYGSEIDTLIGKAINSSVILPELKRFIIEALMVNPYIEELSNFQFEQSGSGVRVDFDCTTVYGKDQITWEAKGGEDSMMEGNMDFSASAVLRRMRDSLQNPANKLEGGFCMDNLQAVSEEISRLDRMEVQPIPDRVMLDTAEGEYLDRRALDYNETRNPAEASVGTLLFTGEPGTAIPSGTEVLCGSLAFETTTAARISAEGYCEVGAQCRTEGTAGNVAANTITVLRVAIDGVKSVTNTAPFKGGTQAE